MLNIREFIYFLKRYSVDKNVSFEERLNKISINSRSQFIRSGQLIYLTGMVGDKSYVILHGEVAFLYAQDFKYDLTEDEYIIYLFKLWAYEEFELLSKCLSLNKNEEIITNKHFLTLITEYKLTLNEINIEKFNLKTDLMREFRYILNSAKMSRKFVDNINEYCERISPFFSINVNNRNSSKFLVTIFRYQVVSHKSVGEIFGNLAMDSLSGKRYLILILRMHTIIVTEDSFLLVFNKKSYDICIKDVCENYKSNMISFILSNKLFTNLDHKLFKIAYFSLFFPIIIKKHQKILVQGKPNDYIYFIRNGDFEISFIKSIMDINFIIKYYGFNPTKEKIEQNDDCKIRLI